MVTQDEQFIDWFLPEDDSVETDVKDIHVTTATSVKGVAPRRVKRKRRLRSRRAQVTRPRLAPVGELSRLLFSCARRIKYSQSCCFNI